MHIMQFVVVLLYTCSTIFSLSNASTQLLYTTRHTVSILDVTDSSLTSQPGGSNVTSSRVLVSGLDDAVCVDYVWSEGSVYWSDVTDGRLLQVFVNESGSVLEVVSSGIVSPDGLACDWVTHKLYWADSDTNRIEVSQLDGAMRRVLYWTQLDQPRSLTLDPQHGYMYWVDWGERAKIERAGMDGTESSRQVLIAETELYWPNGLTLDRQAGRLYWIDVKLQFIDSCNVDGSDRRTVVGSLPHPVTLTLLADTLYWTDWQTHAIYSTTTTTSHNNNNIRVVATNVHMVTDLRAYGPTSQPDVISACTDHNAGCSHLCLLSPIPPFYRCQCPTGVILLPDNKTCADGPSEILLLARSHDLRCFSLDTPDHTDMVLNIHGIQHAVAVDFDPVDKMVYWTDIEARAVRRVHLDGTGSEFVVNVDIDQPDGIAVDWVSRNLYWTDKGTDRIEMSHLNGSARRVLISEGLREPRAIVVDPFEGRMYWTDWGEEAKIESAQLDGSNRLVVINTSLVWPNGLAIDRVERRLYWADAELDVIEMSNFDGSDRRTLISDNIPHVFGLTLLGDYVYWTDTYRRTVERAHKLTGRQRTVLADELPDVKGLTAVNMSASLGVNSCSVDNGGCSHLCIHHTLPVRAVTSQLANDVSPVTTVMSPVCLCPRGMYLQTNGRHCVTPEAFLVYTRRTDIRRLTLGVSVSVSDEVLIDSGVRQASAIDCHVTDARVYWTDTATKTISSAFINGTSVKRVIQFGLNQPEGLTIDWIARNIYWTDFGTGRIEMSRLDGTSRLVLISQDAKPRAIAVDPTTGYLYWSNGISNGPRLERATLDGAGRHSIVSNVGQVSSLTVDYEQQRLYWASIDCSCIETFDLKSGIKRQLITALQQPFGVSIYADNIYWTDWKNHAIETANKDTGLQHSMVLGRLDFPMDLTVCHVSRQHGWNQCAVNNAGCTHLCIADPVSRAGYHCACPTHYMLAADNHTCLTPSCYLLISQQTVISRLPVSLLGESVGVDIALPVSTLRSVRSIVYDTGSDFIFWIDSRTKSIRRAHDDGTQVSVLVPSTVHRDVTVQPYDIVLVSGLMTEPLLYWSDSRHNVISAMTVDGSSIGVVINASRQHKPRHLVVDTCHGLLFWTSVGRPISIYSSSLDGSSRQVLFTTGIWSLAALAIDTNIQRIYWVDIDQKRIESGQYDGSDRRVVASERLSEPIGLTVHGSFLYWVDRTTNTLERVSKETGIDRSVIKARVLQLTDVLSVRREHLSTCSKSCVGTRCSHLCTVSSSGTAVCACPIGYTLSADSRTCVESSVKCSDTEIQCVSLETSRLVCVGSVSLCDGVIDCVDKMDEMNCSMCSVWQFQCVSTRHCILESEHCNEHIDCVDGSDEHGCTVPCSTSNSMLCQADSVCISRSQVCNNYSDCSDSQDERDCTMLASSHIEVGSRHTLIAVGSLAGFVLIVLIVFTYLCWRRCWSLPHCNHHLSDKAAAADVAMKPVKLQPLIVAPSRGGTAGPLYRAPPPFYDRVTGTSSSSGAATDCVYPRNTTIYPPHNNSYPRQTLNPPPSPISTDYSAALSSHRHYTSRQSHVSPCSTDVWHDSATELGYETEALYPPPPTPCSHYTVN